MSFFLIGSEKGGWGLGYYIISPLLFSKHCIVTRVDYVANLLVCDPISVNATIQKITDIILVSKITSIITYNFILVTEDAFQLKPCSKK